MRPGNQTHPPARPVAAAWSALRADLQTAPLAALAQRAQRARRARKRLACYHNARPGTTTTIARRASPAPKGPTAPLGSILLPAPTARTATPWVLWPARLALWARTPLAGPPRAPRARRARFQPPLAPAAAPVSAPRGFSRRPGQPHARPARPSPSLSAGPAPAARPGPSLHRAPWAATPAPRAASPPPRALFAPPAPRARSTPTRAPPMSPPA